MYKISLIENNFSTPVEEVKITHKFFTPLAIKSLKKYKCKKYDEAFIYTFADKISFLIVTDKDKSIKELNKLDFVKYKDGIQLCEENNAVYGCYHIKNNQDIIGDIQSKLPNCHSVDQVENNLIKLNGAQLFLSNKGFYLSDAFNDRIDRFIVMFILALSYNNYNEQIIDELYKLDQGLKLRKMIITRDKYLRYNLFTYFNNPIKQYNHETYAIWDKMSSFYDVEKIHNEVKSQINDFIIIVQNKRNSILTFTFTIIGILVAIPSCIAAFK